MHPRPQVHANNPHPHKHRTPSRFSARTALSRRNYFGFCRLASREVVGKHATKQLQYAGAPSRNTSTRRPFASLSFAESRFPKCSKVLAIWRPAQALRCAHALQRCLGWWSSWALREAGGQPKNQRSAFVHTTCDGACLHQRHPTLEQMSGTNCTTRTSRLTLQHLARLFLRRCCPPLPPPLPTSARHQTNKRQAMNQAAHPNRVGG